MPWFLSYHYCLDAVGGWRQWYSWFESGLDSITNWICCTRTSSIQLQYKRKHNIRFEWRRSCKHWTKWNRISRHVSQYPSFHFVSSKSEFFMTFVLDILQSQLESCIITGASALPFKEILISFFMGTGTQKFGTNFQFLCISLSFIFNCISKTCRLQFLLFNCSVFCPSQRVQNEFCRAMTLKLEKKALWFRGDRNKELPLHEHW